MKNVISSFCNSGLFGFFWVFFFTIVLSHWNFSHGKFGFLSQEKASFRKSRTTHPTVHAECFSVSMIYQTLTWTTGSLTCAQTLMHAIAHGGVQTHVRESALRVDCGRKIPCRTGESNPRQRRDGPMLYPLSYIPILRVRLT